MNGWMYREKDRKTGSKRERAHRGRLVHAVVRIEFIESDRVEEDKRRILCWVLPPVTGTSAAYTILLSPTHPCFSSIFLFDMFGS